MVARDGIPDSCLRGLRASDWVVNGEVKSKAFVPNDATSQKRGDRGSEASINFEDDGHAISVTLKDRENAKYGAVRLCVGAIEDVSPVLGSVSLSYERARLPHNPYHGNIVYAHGLTKSEKNALAGLLAVRSKPVSVESDSRPGGTDAGS
jgi:hypothetical protein